MKKIIILAVILVSAFAFTSCKSIGEEFKTMSDIVYEDMHPSETNSQQ